MKQDQMEQGLRKGAEIAHELMLRDLIAMHAFAARLPKHYDWTLTQLAEQAYLDADALLVARALYGVKP